MVALALSSLLACSEYELTNPLDNGLVDTEDDTSGETGIGDPDPNSVEDLWTIADKTDILFFGDTSGSMAPELVTMGDNITRFTDRIDEFGTDWRLLAVTGPSGCGVNGVITSETADWQSKFATGLQTAPGEDLVDEWGLANAAAAVANTGSGECNQGFMRSDALLHVIFISDEDDNSPGYENGGDYWQSYVQDIQRARGDASNVKFSAVGGPVPGGCDGAEPGTGYWEAVQSTEGQFVSICDDWAAQIEDLASASATQRLFRLSEVPVESTILVTIDGDERDTWTFVPETNQIRFDSDFPLAGQTVSITYEHY